ncbi:MAG: allantoicase [Nocardioides sp.]
MSSGATEPASREGLPDFVGDLDLASRRVGASVMAANDELFAERENLIRPGEPTHALEAFGHKGKTYDGWETRRRREPGQDWAIVRLGAPGVVTGVVVDTSFFRGNYPPEISIEAIAVPGYPGAADLLGLSWTTLVPRSPALGHTNNAYAVTDPHRWTHIRLTIYPDGGVARLRVHGYAVPDPALLTGTIDLAAAELGGRLLDCSDAFYSSPGNLLMPGRAAVMSDGWENARRRDDGNDYATFALAAPGVVRRMEVDTTCFVGNAPGWVRLSGAAVSGAESDESAGGAEAEWRELLARTAVQPDCRHFFAAADAEPVDRVRLDVYPDGGLSRLRIWGELTAEALEHAQRRWLETSP